MTDITNQDRRDMLEWARIAVASKDNQEHEPWVTAARYILATVEAPAPTLAEELRHIAEHWEEWATETITSAIKAAADRAEQFEESLAVEGRRVEKIAAERDEALAEVKRLAGILSEDRTKIEDLTAEVERLTAERNRIANGRSITYAEVDGKPVDADTPNPADVKPGEAWLIGRPGTPGIGVRNRPHTDFPWTVVEDEGHVRVMDSGIVLRSRLVPAPRVITNPDELDELSSGSVVLKDDVSHQLEDSDPTIGKWWYDTGGHGFTANELTKSGPVTVLWEPDA